MEESKFMWVDIEKDGIGDINQYCPYLFCYIRDGFENGACYGFGHFENGSIFIQGVCVPVRVIAYAEIPEFSGERPFAVGSEWIKNKHKASAIMAFSKVINKIKLTKKQKELYDIESLKKEFSDEFLKNEA